MEILEYTGNLHQIRQWSQGLLGYHFNILLYSTRMMQDVDALSLFYDPLVVSYSIWTLQLWNHDCTQRPTLSVKHWSLLLLLWCQNTANMPKEIHNTLPLQFKLLSPIAYHDSLEPFSSANWILSNPNSLGTSPWQFSPLSCCWYYLLSAPALAFIQYYDGITCQHILPLISLLWTQFSNQNHLIQNIHYYICTSLQWLKTTAQVLPPPWQVTSISPVSLHSPLAYHSHENTQNILPTPNPPLYIPILFISIIPTVYNSAFQFSRGTQLLPC